MATSGPSSANTRANGERVSAQMSTDPITGASTAMIGKPCGRARSGSRGSASVFIRTVTRGRTSGIRPGVEEAGTALDNQSWSPWRPGEPRSRDSAHLSPSVEEGCGLISWQNSADDEELLADVNTSTACDAKTFLRLTAHCIRLGLAHDGAVSGETVHDPESAGILPEFKVHFGD